MFGMSSLVDSTRSAMINFLNQRQSSFISLSIPGKEDWKIILRICLTTTWPDVKVPCGRKLVRENIWKEGKSDACMQCSPQIVPKTIQWSDQLQLPLLVHLGASCARRSPQSSPDDAGAGGSGAASRRGSMDVSLIGDRHRSDFGTLTAHFTESLVSSLIGVLATHQRRLNSLRCCSAR